ncbi:MAG: hypothetical protein JXQ29_07160 [Planctomycetes bacterium]|nr:hypothetical protein [Planctomycetota bacterium]
MRPFLPRLCLPVVLLACAPAVPAQPGAYWVSLEDHVGAPDFAFGLNVTPDGAFYHVAIAGTLATNNNQVALIDRVSRSVLARYTVGRFPEEIAYEVLPATPTTPPTAAKIFVSNSSDGTVSVLDSNGALLKTIALGAWDYPYGLAVDVAGKRLAVTTKSLTDPRVYLIDVASLQVVRALEIPSFHGRAAFLADGRLVFGTAIPVPNTTQTRVAAVFVDPDQPSSQQTVELVAAVEGWPSSEDVAVVADGAEVWFSVRGPGAGIYRFDARTATPIGFLSLASVFPSGEIHGLGSSGEGLVLATSLGNFENHVALLETSPPRLLTTIALHMGQQPNDAIFTPDAREACVTVQWGQPGVHILTGLPEPAFQLTADSLTPARGGCFRLGLRGTTSFASSAVGLSIDGAGPVSILGQTVHLTPPIVPLWAGPHDVHGRASVPPISVPDVWTLRGLTLHLQALSQERGFRFRTSNPLTLVIQ